MATTRGSSVPSLVATRGSSVPSPCGRCSFSLVGLLWPKALEWQSALLWHEALVRTALRHGYLRPAAG
eukprot:6492308-Amphidinium_carterae.2